VRAGGLITWIEVEVLAPLVNTKDAGRVCDVEERGIVADPRVSLLALGDETHGICGSEGKVLVLGQERVLALAHVDILVSTEDTAARNRVFLCGLTSDEVIVGIVGDVVGATRSVKFEKVDAAAVDRNANANLVAADSTGPVSVAVSVDFAPSTPTEDEWKSWGVIGMVWRVEGTARAVVLIANAAIVAIGKSILGKWYISFGLTRNLQESVCLQVKECQVIRVDKQKYMRRWGKHWWWSSSDLKIQYEVSAAVQYGAVEYSTRQQFACKGISHVPLVLAWTLSIGSWHENLVSHVHKTYVYHEGEWTSRRGHA
jgi:hypothetical protein